MVRAPGAAASPLLLLLLLFATAAAAAPMELYFSQAELARIAGYGEEPVSTVLVSGQVACQRCLRPGSDLLTFDLPDRAGDLGEAPPASLSGCLRTRRSRRSRRRRRRERSSSRSYGGGSGGQGSGRSRRWRWLQASTWSRRRRSSLSLKWTRWQGSRPSWSPSRMRHMWRPTDASSGRSGRRPTFLFTVLDAEVDAEADAEESEKPQEHELQLTPMYSEAGTEIVNISDKN